MKKIGTISAIILALVFVFNFTNAQQKLKVLPVKLNKIDYTKTDEKPVYGEKNGEAPVYEIFIKSEGKNLGIITVELWPNVAPETVRNFDSLASIKFFDGTAFHRVVPGFVIQGGDPNSKDEPKEKWGYGAPGQREIPAEFSDLEHKRGILSMARGADINSATSQFFICLDDASNLDGKYAIFGQVLKGMHVVDKIVEQPRTGSAPDKKITIALVNRVY